MPTELAARPIKASTKGELKRLRREGFVPVSVQHRGRDTQHFQQEAKPLDDYIRRHGESAMLELVLGRERRTVMVHDVHRDPISRRLTQVVFQEVVAGEPVKAHVAILIQGEPESVRLGDYIAQEALTQVEVRGLAQDLPEHIVADISAMEPGAVLRVGDLPPSDTYQMLTADDTVVVTLVRPRAAVAEEPEPEEAEAVPEASEGEERATEDEQRAAA